MSEPFLQILEHAADGRAGLPGPCFVSEEFFELERSRFFRRHWLCVGLSADAAEPGDWSPVEILDQPLLLARDARRELHVFHNVCSHRGAMLLEAPCNAASIACPYHCWTYDSGGRLLRTPHVAGAGRHRDPKFDRRLYGLREIDSVEFGGLVFACLGEPLESFESSFGPLLDRWRGTDLGHFVPAPGMTLRPSMRANWKIAIENFVESYHLPWVHPQLNRVNPMGDHYQILGGRHYVGQGSTTHSGTAIGSEALPIATGGADRAHGEAMYLPPNLMLTRFPDFMMVNIVFPLRPDLTEERIELFVHAEAATGSRFRRAREELMQFLRSVNDEDIAICEKVQRGRRSDAFRGGVFAAQQEATSRQFQQLLALRMLQGEAATDAVLPTGDIPHRARAQA